MVSLLISKLGKLISGHPPQAVYEVLARHKYLSETGVAEPDAVVSVLQQVIESWPSTRGFGDEIWRHMETALQENGFLSPKGLAATRKFVGRGW